MGLPSPGCLELHLAHGLKASPRPPHLLGQAAERCCLPHSLPLATPFRSQAAHLRHRSASRCAMLWKQKALCRKASQASPGLPKKRVTFRVPLPTATSGASGDPAAAAGQRSLPRPAPSVALPSPPAAGGSVLAEL